MKSDQLDYNNPENANLNSSILLLNIIWGHQNKAKEKEGKCQVLVRIGSNMHSKALQVEM